MTCAVTDDHLWRRGAAAELHYAPHSLIGRAMLGVSREVCCSAGLCAWPLQHESYLILKSWFCRSSSSGAGGGRQRKTDRSAFPIETEREPPRRSKVSQCELASSFAATVWFGRAGGLFTAAISVRGFQQLKRLELRVNSSARPCQVCHT